MKQAGGVLLLALLISGCAHHMNAKNELYGNWRCATAVVDGKNLPPETTKLLKLTIDERTYKTEKGTEVLFESTYTTDTTKTPKEINIIGTEGDLAGKPAQGIYSIQGDNLEICYTMPGGPRPARFESASGSKAYWIVWKREGTGR